eukprot:7376429-Prymnesium_polylepis.1
MRPRAAYSVFAWPMLPALVRTADEVRPRRAPIPSSAESDVGRGASPRLLPPQNERRRALCLSQVLEVEPQPRWQLSDHQWGKVSASPYFARHPGAKLLPRRAICQTLQSSYKRGYMIYSQFVPQPPPANPRFFTPRGSWASARA